MKKIIEFLGCDCHGGVNVIEYRYSIFHYCRKCEAMLKYEEK